MKKYSCSFRLRFLLVGILCYSVFALGQEPIIIGHKMSIYSKVLQEDRSYWISLPKSYHDTIYSKKSYPVCYFFDGDLHFENLVAQSNRLSGGVYASIPEMILVGIIQKERAWELTPSSMKPPEKWKKANVSKNGGNKVFMEFLEQDLKPLIKKTYRTKPYEVLLGHSFGGLAVVNAFINNPDYYNAYVAIDPSMWWDNERLLLSIDSLWKPDNYQHKTFVLAKANDHGSGEEHHSAILGLEHKMDSLYASSGLRYSYLFYPEEGHGSVVVPAEYDAIRFLFKGYQLPVKKLMKKPELLDEHYNTISSKIAYKVDPDERIIDKIAQVCERREFFEQAEELLHQNAIYFPNSKHAKIRYQNFLEKKKNTQN